MTDSITLVQARCRRLAKVILSDGAIQDYDNARSLNLSTRPASDLDTLHVILLELLGRPDVAVVRGRIADPNHTTGVRRLLHTDPETGEVPTLLDVPRRWLALDMDGLERPDTVAAAELAECARYALLRLPEAFHRARCIAQASASHGVKPGVRMRLWFWLDRQTTGAELKRWLRGTPTDPSVFSAAQLIYTAAPLFAFGVADHLPTRIVAIPGTPMVKVPSAATLSPPPRPPPRLPSVGIPSGNRYAFAALRNAVTRVSTAPVGNRHPTCLSEARSLARFVEAGLLSGDEVRACLLAAAAMTGKPESEIASVLEWAFSHPSSAPLPTVNAR